MRKTTRCSQKNVKTFLYYVYVFNKKMKFVQMQSIPDFIMVKRYNSVYYIGIYVTYLGAQYNGPIKLHM